MKKAAETYQTIFRLGLHNVMRGDKYASDEELVDNAKALYKAQVTVLKDHVGPKHPSYDEWLKIANADVDDLVKQMQVPEGLSTRPPSLVRTMSTLDEVSEVDEEIEKLEGHLKVLKAKKVFLSPEIAEPA